MVDPTGEEGRWPDLFVVAKKNKCKGAVYNMNSMNCLLVLCGCCAAKSLIVSDN